MTRTVSTTLSNRGTGPFRPSLRHDLQWVYYPNQSQWVAHDPIAGGYFRLNEFEYFAAQLMDGARSLADIIRDTNRKFAAMAIDQDWLTNLVQRLQSSFLLQPSRHSSRWIANQCENRKTSVMAQFLLNPLTIRVPLFDPGTLLLHVKWLAHLLFNRAIIFFVALSATICGFLVLRRILENAAVLNVDPTRITADRWLVLLACFIFAKSLHEFGHMLACARYGVRSAEVGLLFLCLTPCFYCETTDTWKLPSKWQRAMIAAAGIYVEIVLAVLGAALWLMTREGTLNLIAFNVMVICSLSTLLVNANPLFRFDGYFILSDLWQIPNLHDQSRRAISLLFEKYVLLKRRLRFDLDGNVWLLAAFAVASALYRTSMLVGILWFCWSYLPSAGLGLLAIAISASVVAGMLNAYWKRAKTMIRAFAMMHLGQRVWALTVLIAFVGLTVTAMCWPVHQRVSARAIIDFEDKQPIYVSYDSKVTFLADCNRRCIMGSELVRLESPDAQMEMLKLEGTKDRIANELNQLRLTQGSQPEAGYSIPTLEKQLATLTARHAVLLEEIGQLTVRAPQDGYLIDAHSMVSKNLASIRDDRFKPSLFSKENANCWALRSQLIGWFSPRQRPVVIALVPEHQLSELAIGMAAIVRIDSEVGRDLYGKIIRIATDSMETVPDSLLGDESFPSTQNVGGSFNTEVPHYEVTIAIEDTQLMIFGAVATVSFALEKAPLYQYIINYVRLSVKPLVL